MSKIMFNEKNIIKIYAEGMESTIYLYSYGTKLVFLKLFKRKIKIGNEIIRVSSETMNNKERKLELIPSLEAFDNEVLIMDSVYDDKENFIGYTMSITTFKNATSITRTNEKIEILKLIKEKIEMFNKDGIYIGDFNPANILITDTGIMLCDLDNFRIGELDFDLISSFQHNYLQNCDKIDNIDNYCFNLFTICYLGKIYQPYVYDYLIEEGLPKKLDTKQNRIIANELIDLTNNYQKKYLIDNIKKFL